MPTITRRPVGRFALLFALAVVAGCGGERTYRVTGTVTFNGRPVPEGKIFFSPDSSKQAAGASGYADIKDGRFDTATAGGRNVVGGPMIVAIEGGDPAAGAKAGVKTVDGEPGNLPLFPRWETTVDLPKGDCVQDFDVPATKGKR